MTSINEYFIIIFTEFTEQNSAIGLMRKDDFIALTNFTFRFVCKVTSSDAENADQNGFIVEVKTQAGNGEEEKGYVQIIIRLYGIKVQVAIYFIAKCPHAWRTFP